MEDGELYSEAVATAEQGESSELAEATVDVGIEGEAGDDPSTAVSVFEMQDGKWMATVTTIEGQTLQVELLAHDLALQQQVMSLEVGSEPIVNSANGVNLAGQPVVFSMTYARTESGIVAIPAPEVPLDIDSALAASAAEPAAPHVLDDGILAPAKPKPANETFTRLFEPVTAAAEPSAELVPKPKPESEVKPEDNPRDKGGEAEIGITPKPAEQPEEPVGLLDFLEQAVTPVDEPAKDSLMGAIETVLTIQPEASAKPVPAAEQPVAFPLKAEAIPAAGPELPDGPTGGGISLEAAPVQQPDAENASRIIVEQALPIVAEQPAHVIEIVAPAATEQADGVEQTGQVAAIEQVAILEPAAEMENVEPVVEEAASPIIESLETPAAVDSQIDSQVEQPVLFDSVAIVENAPLAVEDDAAVIETAPDMVNATPVIVEATPVAFTESPSRTEAAVMEVVLDEQPLVAESTVLEASRPADIIKEVAAKPGLEDAAPVIEQIFVEETSILEEPAPADDIEEIIAIDEDEAPSEALNETTQQIHELVALEHNELPVAVDEVATPESTFDINATMLQKSARVSEERLAHETQVRPATPTYEVTAPEPTLSVIGEEEDSQLLHTPAQEESEGQEIPADSLHAEVKSPLKESVAKAADTWAEDFGAAEAPATEDWYQPAHEAAKSATRHAEAFTRPPAAAVAGTDDDDDALTINFDTDERRHSPARRRSTTRSTTA